MTQTETLELNTLGMSKSAIKRARNCLFTARCKNREELRNLIKSHFKLSDLTAKQWDHIKELRTTNDWIETRKVLTKIGVKTRIHRVPQASATIPLNTRIDGFTHEHLETLPYGYKTKLIKVLVKSHLEKTDSMPKIYFGGHNTIKFNFRLDKNLNKELIEKEFEVTELVRSLLGHFFKSNCELDTDELVSLIDKLEAE